MSVKRKAKVIMLPTKQATGICTDDRSQSHPKLLLYHKPSYQNELGIQSGNTKNFHLYICVDEKIKEGDYAIYDNGMNIPFIVIAVSNKHGLVYRKPSETWKDYGHESGGITPLESNVKKIIATTDLSIVIEKGTLSINQGRFYNHYPTEKKVLGELSKPFITKYIEEYNKGNVITDVLVEYETATQFRVFKIK